METPNTYWDLFFGYFALWAILFLLVLRIASEQRRLLRKLEPGRDAAGR